MFSFNGQTYYVPGVYGTIEVIQLGGVNLPIFNTLLFIGSAKKGVPYNAPGIPGYQAIQAFSDVKSASDYYGASSPIIQAMNYAKSGGAGVIFTLNSASLTLGKATVLDNAGIPANTFDIAPQNRFYGASGNDIALTISTTSGNTTMTITPPKLTRFLSANATTTTPYINLDSVSGLVIGQTILLTSNAATGAPDSFTIVSINSTNNQITLSGNPSLAWATSAYARIYQEDLDNMQVQTFGTTNTINDVISWINNGNILTANRNNYTGQIPTTLAKKQLQLFTSATLGTSPAAVETTGGDYDNLAASLPQILAQFENFNGFRIRLMDVLTSSSSVHAVFRTLTTTMRANQKPIQLILGCALGDINAALSAANHPIQRAKVLNADDVILAGMGLDGLDAYLSLAPFYAGLISANSVKHNLTNDTVYAGTVEYYFGSSNKTTTAQYLANGVLVVGTGKDGFYVVQAINTYQYQSTEWNQTDKKTYLTMQRQIVDFVYEGYKNQMALGVGADGYDATVASVQGLAILSTYQNDGFITGAQMLAAYQQGNAVITEPQIIPLQGVDYVGFTLKVLINN